MISSFVRNVFQTLIPLRVFEIYKNLAIDSPLVGDMTLAVGSRYPADPTRCAGAGCCSGRPPPPPATGADTSADPYRRRASDADAVAATSDRVVINVGGRRFTTTWSTLRRLPSSRLARLRPTVDDPSSPYDADADEFFFDRSPALFDYILDAHRHGELHIPHYACSRPVRKELAFWNVGADLMADCCLRRHLQDEVDRSTERYVDQLLASDTVDAYPPPTTTTPPSPQSTQSTQVGTLKKRCMNWKMVKLSKERVWEFLEDPKSSTAAHVSFKF